MTPSVAQTVTPSVSRMPAPPLVEIDRPPTGVAPGPSRPGTPTRATIDVRRASVGLGTLDDYLEELARAP